jgi:hypothetical protein
MALEVTVYDLDFILASLLWACGKGNTAWREYVAKEALTSWRPGNEERGWEGRGFQYPLQGILPQ